MMNRRTMFTAALAAAAAPLVTQAARAQAGMSRITVYAFSFPASTVALSVSPTTPAVR
jgi:glutathione peroxidase